VHHGCAYYRFHVTVAEAAARRRVDEEVQRVQQHLSSSHTREVDTLSSQLHQRIAALEASEARWRSDAETRARELSAATDQLQQLRVCNTALRHYHWCDWMRERTGPSCIVLSPVSRRTKTVAETLLSWRVGCSLKTLRCSDYSLSWTPALETSLP
jgi:hypothetical protein